MVAVDTEKLIQAIFNDFVLRVKKEENEGKVEDVLSECKRISDLCIVCIDQGDIIIKSDTRTVGLMASLLGAFITGIQSGYIVKLEKVKE